MPGLIVLSFACKAKSVSNWVPDLKWRYIWVLPGIFVFELHSLAHFLARTLPVGGREFFVKCVTGW